MKQNKKEQLPLSNDKIRATSLQLITHDGTNVGIVSRDDALDQARDVDLDLVIISDSGTDGVPIAKIMDLGKSQYEKKKKQAEAKKHQKVILVKEIKIRPKIGPHDFQTKIKQAIQFLNEGKRVKMTLWFRGRENALKEQRGTELFAQIEQSFEEQGLTKNLTHERDAKVGQTWSRIYFLKGI